MNEHRDVFQSNLIAASKNLIKHWFVLGLTTAIALGLAFLYNKVAARQYYVKTSILLITEGSSNTFGATNEVLRAFDFMLSDKKFQNEVFYLQSYPLVREVVELLDYRVGYYIQEKNFPIRFSFARKNIYKESPFIVVPRENHVQPIGVFFHVRIIDEKKFKIYAYKKSDVQLLELTNERVVQYGANYNLEGIFEFGEQIENEKSSFSIALNSNFQPASHLNRDLFFTFNNYNDLTGYFKGALSINSKERESTLAEIIVRVENRSLGIAFLDALVNSYIEKNIDEANFLANQTIEHIDNQLVDVADDLSASERQLQQIRSSQRIMNIEEKSQNVYGELQGVRLLRDDAQRRLNQLSELYNYYSENRDSTGVIAPPSLGLNDPMLLNLVQELTNLTTERQRIISQDQLRNPRLVQLENSIESLKKVIIENLRFSINNTQNLINNFNNEINSLNRDFASLPETQRQLLGVERRFSLNDAVYTFLLERRIQAQIIKASKLPDAKVIEPPRSAGTASPRTTIIYLFSIMLGFGVPAAFLLGKDLIINTVKNKEDIKFLTSFPVIATIPKNTTNIQNVVFDAPRSIASESFHILRSNLVYFLHGKFNRVILLTSSIPGEGKSYLALNIAASFSMTNSKTVLVEFDLRKPTNYAGVVQIKEYPGLSSYLIEKANIEDIIIPTKIPGFDVIHSGQVPPNPIELIHSPRTEELIVELKKKYKYVILDTPPYGPLADPFVLMKYSDLNLYVSRAGYTKKREFLKNMEDIESKKIANLYVVVNDDTEERKSYMDYKYYSNDQNEKGFLRKKISSVKLQA